MQDDAQNILLEIKHDIMDGQTFFPFFFEKDRMGNAETYSHAKDSLKKFSQKTRPWEPPCLSGGTGGSAELTQAQSSRPTLCRAEHAKLQNMRRWFERIIVGS